MFLLYDQFYDDITFIGISESEEETKEYAEYFGYQYREVNPIQSKRYWPKKINLYRAHANISNNKMQILKHNQIIFESQLPNNYLDEGIRITNDNIYATSHSSQEEADKMLEEILQKYRIRHRPRLDFWGGIVSEFVLC